MSNDEFICVRCARHRLTCCQISEVYATPGDVDRITAHTGRDDFSEFRVPDDPYYLDQDDDPAWREHVFRPDSSRRVLKREANGNCTFLGPQGCTLPYETRPLVCRLYPYDYNEDGIRTELVEGCPLELLPPGQGLIEALDMRLEDARRWHRQLYAEIRLETNVTCTSD
jgi:Fe-S-cluster containining protein